MVKKTTETPVVTESAPVELDNSAFTIVKNEYTYSVVKVMVNKEGNQAGKVEIVEAGLSREAAENLFKVQVATEIFLKVG